MCIRDSYWSLLAPAIEISEELGYPGWLPPLIGFLAGGGALRLDVYKRQDEEN